MAQPLPEAPSGPGAVRGCGPAGRVPVRDRRSKPSPSSGGGAAFTQQLGRVSFATGRLPESLGMGRSMVPALGSPERPRLLRDLRPPRPLGGPSSGTARARGGTIFSCATGRCRMANSTGFWTGSLPGGARSPVARHRERPVGARRHLSGGRSPSPGGRLPGGGGPRPVSPAAGLLLGRSVHRLEAAVAAERDGADYVIPGDRWRRRAESGPCGPRSFGRPVRRSAFPSGLSAG